MSDIIQRLERQLEIHEVMDIPLKNGTIGLFPETIQAAIDEIERLNELVKIATEEDIWTTRAIAANWTVAFLLGFLVCFWWGGTL